MSETTSAKNKRFRKDYQLPPCEIENVELFFHLDVDTTKVKSRWNYKNLKQMDLTLDGVGLKLLTLRLNAKALESDRYQIFDEKLILKDLPSEGEIEIEVELCPLKNDSLEGLYQSRGSLCTQCEPEGFRKITYFLDRPDVMCSFLVTLQADKNKFPVLLSNGDRISRSELPDGQHQIVYRDPFKKPCYLFALFAGDLGLLRDQYTTGSGRKVELEIYSAHGTQKRCLHAMNSLKKAMKWDEERFGLEYDLDQYMIVAIDDFNAGAMENKGLNIFNSRLILADAETATDDDYFHIESVVGHEYFHNWTGNRVTLRDWFQLSLKEGLTVFRDQEFSGDMTDRQLQRIRDVDSLRERQFAEDAGPKAHPVRPEFCLSVDNFFTATIYEKGAEVIRMMQTLVGRPGFRKGMDEYFRRHDGHAVTIEDFAQAIAEPNNINFEQFKLWYSQYGTPQVEVREHYDAEKHIYNLDLKQSLTTLVPQKEVQPFHIPLRFGLLNSEGKEIEIDHPEVRKNSENHCYLELKDGAKSIQFKNLKQKPHLSILRDFSAPVNLVWNPSLEELYFLIENDSDSFNRRELMQRIELQLLNDWIKKLSEGKELTSSDLPSSFISCFRKILNDTQMNHELKALMLTLPSENRLLQSLAVLQPELMEKSMTFLIRSLAQNLQEDFQKNFELAERSADRPESRALKNRILSYFAESPNQEQQKLIGEQYWKAKVMTERYHALALLCDRQDTSAQEAINDFHDRYRKETLVLNKWFSAQSFSRNQNTFERVKSLTHHPDFNIKNPNNVYSLLRSFGQNIFRFHDGKKPTYEFMVDKIVEIDDFNPQVAARLCEAFQSIGKWPKEQKTRFLGYLEEKSECVTLSKNTHEWVESLLSK